MTVCGDPNLIAVELVPGPGRFCGARLWLAGASVGEPELYGTAGALADGLARFRKRARERDNPSLFGEPAHTCLDIIEQALFGPSDDLETSASNGQKYGAFLLSPNLCESLDAFLIVLVSDGSRQRILARSYTDGTFVQAMLPDGVVEQALEDAGAFLLRMEEEEPGGP